MNERKLRDMLNQCQFIGHLGADPEIRTMTNGGKVCNLRLAVTEKWKDKSGDRKEKTEWVSVVVFSDGLAGVAERYLRKGSKVYVSGKLQTRKWTDKDGNDRYSTEIVLQGFDAKLVMLDSANGESREQQQSDNGGGGSNYDDLDDDVPF